MPKISVVISTYNRCNLLKKAIDQLLGQMYSNFEIIVIDDGSSDATKDVLKSYLDKIRYYYQENSGVSAARNHGIREARGEYVVFSDDDVVMESHWLESLAHCFQVNCCDAIGGRVLPTYPDKTPQWVKDNPTKLAGVVVICDYGQETFLCDKNRSHLIGANFAFRKDVFKECGNFREDIKFKGRIALGEDTEFIERIIKKNKTVYYCAQALVYHPVDLARMSLKNTIDWNLNYGYFSAWQEKELNSKNLKYWFGVPRYLYRGIIIDSVSLIFSILNRLAFYIACRNFFRKVGMFQEYLNKAPSAQKI